MLSVTDAQILANKCEGTILVVNSGKAEKDGVIKAKEALVASQANLLGVVLNNMKRCPLHQFDDFGDICVPELCESYDEYGGEDEA